MSLTADETAELATLKSARTKLLAGQAVVKAAYNGFETTFTPGSLDRIEARIELLEGKDAGSSGKRRGALGFGLR